MRHLIILINTYEQGNPISLIIYEPNLKETVQAKAVRKFIGLRKHMKPTLPKMIFMSPFFSSSVFAHISPSLINISTAKFPWNKIDKTPTFIGITPHVTILTVLGAIRTSRDGMADEVWGGNVV